VAIVIMMVVMMMVAFMMTMVAMVAMMAMAMAAWFGESQIHHRGARHYGPCRGSEPRDEIPTGFHSHVLLAPSLWRCGAVYLRALLRDPLARTHVQT
jgi:hypothetical protein